MEFDDLKYDTFEELSYSYLDEPMTVWQAHEIDLLMTKPSAHSDLEFRMLGEISTYGEAVERIKWLKDGLR